VTRSPHKPAQLATPEGRERLVTQGESPLYGRDVAALRAELRRARVLLASD
jgi:hypothetical protein